jgi:hypothetical protein
MINWHLEPVLIKNNIFSLGIHCQGLINACIGKDTAYGQELRSIALSIYGFMINIRGLIHDE